MSKKLYVGNLNFQTTESELSDKFSEFGSVVSAKIIMDRETNRSKGFAFIEMSSEDEAQACISALDSKDFSGRNIKVNEAQERAPRNNSRW